MLFIITGEVDERIIANLMGFLDSNLFPFTYLAT